MRNQLVLLREDIFYQEQTINGLRGATVPGASLGEWEETITI